MRVRFPPPAPTLMESEYDVLAPGDCREGRSWRPQSGPLLIYALAAFVLASHSGSRYIGALSTPNGSPTTRKEIPWP